jgi:hypothetical protein
MYQYTKLPFTQDFLQDKVSASYLQSPNKEIKSKIYYLVKYWMISILD